MSNSYIASELAWQRSPARQAMAKAAEYRETAGRMTDPVMAEHYREMARKALDSAGLADSGSVAKAAEYERQERLMADPAQAAAYHDLAEAERRRVGVA